MTETGIKDKVEQVVARLEGNPLFRNANPEAVREDVREEVCAIIRSMRRERITEECERAFGIKK